MMWQYQALSAAWKTARNPKWVHSFYTGIDALSGFSQESLMKGQTLTNAKGAYSPSLAEWVMTSCLYFNKQIQRCQANREQKVWDKFVMDTLYGKTIGFVGYGHIAQSKRRGLMKGKNDMVPVLKFSYECKTGEGFWHACAGITEERQ